MVRAIEDTGLTIMFGNWLIQLSGGTSFGAVMVGTAGAALGTNLINNVPMAVVMISALAGIQHAAPPIQHGFIAATIFGCDLGPNLTTVGSLATVLWLLILRQRNVDVSGLDYFKVGVVVTPLMRRLSGYFCKRNIEGANMRVLCCLDGTNVEQVSKATEMLLARQSLTLAILYVIDTGPRREIEQSNTDASAFRGHPARQGRASTRCSRQSTQPQRIS